MLRALSRWQAIAILALIALALAAALTIRPDTTATDGTDANGEVYSDIRLYQDTVARMVRGEGYYPAVTALQREHGFPTRPFVTVRLPTLPWLASKVGWEALHIVLIGLLFGTAAAWFATLPQVAPAERIGVAMAVLAGGAMVSQAGLTAQYELWGGILVTLALALRGPKLWRWGWLAGAAALAIRELALPFVLLAAGWGVLGRRQREATAWALLAAAFLIALWIHAGAVSAQALPGDKASQGWLGLRGAGAPLRDLVDVSLLNLIPRPAAYAVTLLAPLGWAALPDRRARIALVWFAGFALLLGAFARPVNFYWAIMLVPAWFVGFAFVPRALRDLAKAALFPHPIVARNA